MRSFFGLSPDAKRAMTDVVLAQQAAEVWPCANRARCERDYASHMCPVGWSQPECLLLELNCSGKFAL
eukprot:6491506-Amphidinium_carterae.4